MSDSAGLGQSLRISIFHTFPGGADATCLEVTLGEPVLDELLFPLLFLFLLAAPLGM